MISNHRCKLGGTERFHSLSDALQLSVRETAGQTHVDIDGLSITSAFQPVYSFSHQKAVGYEGLMRAYQSDGSVASPLEVFSRLDGTDEVTRIDRACRALHLKNSQLQGLNDGWLFLNVHSNVLARSEAFGSFFAKLLLETDRLPHSVVIEVLEDAIEDVEQLADAVACIKDLGCLVAIDDFGAGHSNFERIWRTKPDIVKLDRSMLTHAGEKREVRRVLPELVSLLHQTGCLVVMEGIETKDDALVAMESDVDFAQGYYLSPPAQEVTIEAKRPAILGELTRKFIEHANAGSKRRRQQLAAIVPVFEQSAMSLQAGVDLATASVRIVNRQDVMGCYLLNEDGIQLGPARINKHAQIPENPKYQHISNGDGGNWYRRPYFLQAIEEPGRVHVSPPYLSVTNAELCTTLSIGIRLEYGVHVLCADIWVS